MISSDSKHVLPQSGFPQQLTYTLLSFAENGVVIESWGAACLRWCCRMHLICRASLDLSCPEWNVILRHPNASVSIRRLCLALVRWQAAFLWRRKKRVIGSFLHSILWPPHPVLKLNKHSLLSEVFSTLTSNFTQFWCENLHLMCHSIIV